MMRLGRPLQDFPSGTVLPLRRSCCCYLAGVARAERGKGGARPVRDQGTQAHKRRHHSVREPPITLRDDGRYSPRDGTSTRGHHSVREPPITLRRSDCTYGSGPWRITRSGTVEELALVDVIRGLDLQGCKDGRVVVKLVATKSGRGSFYVTGHFDIANLVFFCDRCMRNFSIPSSGSFECYLPATVPDGYSPQDNEVPFPMHARYVDLTGIVQDAVVAALPTKCLCAQPHCGAGAAVGGQAAVPGWSAGGARGDSNSQGLSALSNLKQKLI